MQLSYAMGFLIAFLSTFVHTAKDLVSKKLTLAIDGTTSTFCSFAYALPFYLILLGVCYLFGYEVITFSTHFLLLVLLRSLSDSGAEWCKMQAIGYAEISLIAPFLALSPVFLLVFSPLITGDPLTANGVLAIVLSLGGSAFLLSKPKGTRSPEAMKGIGFGIMSSFFFSLNICFDRLAVQVASPVFSGFMMTLVATFFFLPAVVLRRDRLTSIAGAGRLLSLRGGLEVAFMVTKLSALTFLQAPYVAAVSRLSILFSIIGGRILFKEEDLKRRLIAGLLIVSGAVVAVLGKL